MVVSPDKKMLLAASAGFNDPGLSLLDIASRRVTQFFPLQRIWNGLAFSLDGRRIFVSGGDSGKVHVFKYADGKAASAASVKPSPNALTVFLAGIAVNPSTGKVYVCNEANDEIWVLNEQTLALETTVAVGEHPHSCIFGADKRHLYVSNWGSRSVSVVDTQREPARAQHPGRHPAQRHGAGTGRAAVRGVQRRQYRARHPDQNGEKQAPEASLKRRPPEDAREIISTSLYPGSPEGSTPDGVAVSPDGKTLFVANADNNSVLVVDISNALSEDAQRNHESVSVVNGFIPVGLVSERRVREPGQPDALRRQREGLGLRIRTTLPAAIGRRGRRAGSHSITSQPCSRARCPSSAGPTRRRWRPTLNRSGAIRLTRPRACTGRPSPARASSPSWSASRARSSTCSTSSRRTAPTTRCSAI